MISRLPLSVFLLVWAAPICLLVAGAFEGQVSTLTLTICLAGILSTAAGSLLAGRGLVSHSSKLGLDTLNVRAALIVLASVALSGGAIVIWRWIQIGINPFLISEGSLYAMNVLVAEEGGVSSGVIGRMYSVIPVLMLAATYHYLNGQERKLSFVLLILSIVLLALNPRRHLVIQSVVACALAYACIRKPSIKRMLLVGVVGLLSVSIYLGATQVVLKKADVSGLMASLSVVRYYYTSSVFVMDALIPTSHFEDVWIVLNTPARVYSLVFDVPLQVDLSVPFVSVPEPSNTVPSFYYLYKAGGFLGVVIGSFALGWLVALLWRIGVTRGSFASVAMASVFATSLIFSVREFTPITYDFATQLVVIAIYGVAISKRIVIR